MKQVLFVLLAFIFFSCGGKTFKIGDFVKTNQRCMATSTESTYNQMQTASESKNSSVLENLMNNGELLILNDGQPGEVVQSNSEMTQIRIYGGSTWWVATRFLRIR